MTNAGSTVLPIVDYFVPDAKSPHLSVLVCDGCGARYLERRNGCGRCGGRNFSRRSAPTTGTVKAYTVVWRSEPGVEVPFVSCLVDFGEGLVAKSNLVGIDPDTVDLTVLGRSVDLVSRHLGIDSNGTLALTFAFKLRQAGK
jgi:uncharacterized OB-fold protein